LYEVTDNSKLVVCRLLAITPDPETGRQFREIIAFSVLGLRYAYPIREVDLRSQSS